MKLIQRLQRFHVRDLVRLKVPAQVTAAAPQVLLLARGPLKGVLESVGALPGNFC